MFADYVALVLADYHQQRFANTLSPRLVDPTPAKLKQECISVINARYESRDEGTLRIFFDIKDGVKSSDLIIERFDTDKFKPLSNYLKNQTNVTDRKNIELLAWLLNFQPRPYEFGRKYRPVTIANSGISKEEDTHDGEKEEALLEEHTNTVVKQRRLWTKVFDYGKPYLNSKAFAVIAAIIVVAVAGTMFYRMQENSRYGKIRLTGLEKCMYWAGDYYEQVSCYEKFGYDTIVVAFDSVRFHGLKRVTSPDTITLNAIGRLWYIKRNNKYEFFTSDGYYPADPKFRLRPVTERIIKNEIQSRQVSK